MANDAIKLMVLFRPKPAHAAKLRGAVQALVAPTRREPGCIEYRLHEVIGDSGELVLYEEWASQGDLDRHVETPAVRSLLASLGEWLVEPLKVRRLRDLGA